MSYLHVFTFSLLAFNSKKDFERRFRITRALFQRILSTLDGKGKFNLYTDATGKRPVVRLLSVLLIFAYCKSFEKVDELCELAASVALNSFKSFIKLMPQLFGEVYLRCPLESDLTRILSINEVRVFTGCVGSWDCQYWKWKKLPVALVGQFKGRSGKRIIVLESIADRELWIWGCHYGNSGSMNDINMLDSSSIVEKMLKGEMLLHFEYKFHKKTL